MLQTKGTRKKKNQCTDCIENTQQEETKQQIQREVHKTQQIITETEAQRKSIHTEMQVIQKDKEDIHKILTKTTVYPKWKDKTMNIIYLKRKLKGSGKRSSSETKTKIITDENIALRGL